MKKICSNHSPEAPTIFCRCALEAGHATQHKCSSCALTWNNEITEKPDPLEIEAPNPHATFEAATVAFVESFVALSKAANEHAHKAGFYDKPATFGDKIALMHSELSEALEAFRHGNKPSEHIPVFSGIEEEFADTIIRIMDTCYERKDCVAAAVVTKMRFNLTRPYRHGNKVI